LLLVCCLLIVQEVWSAGDGWQAGRIADVKKSVESRTLYWVVNTPVTRDETSYTISVQLDRKLISGSYQPDQFQDPPPAEWTPNHPVRVRIHGDYMYLKLISGPDLKTRIIKRKNSEAMEPVTEEELKAAYSPVEPKEPSSEFSSSASEKTGSAEPNSEETKKEEVSQPQVRGPAGTLAITTVPYLADVYVDGKDIGYSPAKVSLPVGKHTVRCEKNGYKVWTRDLEVEQDSELTVNAALEKR
jgi:hypothetical protein